MRSASLIRRAGRRGSRTEALARLQKRVIACRKCPRLVRYLRSIRAKYPAYWCRPVPSFGDPEAKILILGLAPGRFGANRTGRMFTGDASGRLLYQTLHAAGLSNLPQSLHRKDRLKLRGAYLTAALRCAPPQNKPAVQELANCHPYLEAELALLKRVRVVVALGKIAFDAYFKWARAQSPLRKKDFPFKHGAVYEVPGTSQVVIASYHPSRQNTQTGKLTPGMFRKIFEKACEIAGQPKPTRRGREKRR